MATVAPAVYGVNSPIAVGSSPFPGPLTGTALSAVPYDSKPSAGGCGCGCTGKDLVNGAALDCPDDKTFNKPACLKGSGPCACWA